MTVEWFDLGQRFKAFDQGRCVPRLLHAPMVPGGRPIAVRVQRQPRTGRVLVEAAGRNGARAAGWDMDGLAGLEAVGATLDQAEPATLVVDDPGTLPALVGLAHKVGAGDRLEATAAQVGWWAERADFPGGLAVADLTAGCRARWVTGQDPDVEGNLAVWRRWLDVADTHLPGMLTVYDLICAGPVLPLLADLGSDDVYSYGQAVKALSEGWDWRRPDTVSRAAVGLRSRCDAADVYSAALLSDPLWRLRQVHTGEVVIGEVSDEVPAQGVALVEVRCARLDARLRVGTDVVWWVGGPATPVRSGGWVGTVRQATVEQGRLVLSVRVGARRDATVHAGQTVTLMPAPPSVHRQRSGQRLYRRLQFSRRSWLVTGRPATTTRRTVPLDVLLAGAEAPLDAGGDC